MADCDPTLISVPSTTCKATGEDPLPRSCPVRDGAACTQGDATGCPAPAFPELTCKDELPCDDDIPLVDITLVEPGVQFVNVSWIGVNPTDDIEFLVTGKFYDLYADPLVPFYELNDYAKVNDVGTGITGVIQLGAFITDRVYTISARRVRDGKVGVWSAENTIGVPGEHTYIVDGEDIMVDDYYNVEENEVRSASSARVAPTIIIDDEVP